MSRSRTKSSAQTSTPPLSHHLRYRLREGCFIITVAVSIFLWVALLSYHPTDPSWSNNMPHHAVANATGRVGAWLADFLLYILGYFAFILPITMCFASWLYFRHRHHDFQQLWGKWTFLLIRLCGFILILCSATTLASIHIIRPLTALPFNAGGILGTVIGTPMLHAFNIIGATVILIAVLLLGVTLFTGWSWLLALEKLGAGSLWLSYYIGSLIKKIPWRNMSAIWHFLWRKKAKVLSQSTAKIKKTKTKIKVAKPKEPKISVQQEDYSETEDLEPRITKPTIMTKQPPAVDHKALDYKAPKPAGQSSNDVLPLLSLLDSPKVKRGASFNEQQLEQMSRDVELRLADFGVQAQVVSVHPGPVVTRYELQLAAGTKVSKITGLAKDLARSLLVVGVRVVDVIPGKSVIGLELPNENREMVSLQEVLASKPYHKARSALTLALGKDIAGLPVIVDLAKMPHLLVAGTTGSGKSVCLNAMLLSLLYKSTPQQLRLILIDPKMLELSIYDGIPHLLTPVVTDMKDAASALRWCVAEMERRYRLMAALGVRNIAGYNAKVAQARKQGKPLTDPLQPAEIVDEPAELEELPQIAVVADEFADMMVVVGKKVETLIARLAQKARAAGVHLILATQRPSVDVITGLIKANIPTRIAFQVSSKIDSRTILDQQGAEQLLGHGDMLYLPPGSGLPVRVHGAYVSDDEVHRVVSYLKEHGQEDYIEDLLSESAAIDPSGYAQAVLGDQSPDGEKDPLYDQAVDAVIRSQRVSVSSVQRRFKIGYNRAARIVESMEAAGVVSSMENSGNRQVLVSAPQE